MQGEELRKELQQAWRVALGLVAPHLSPESRKAWEQAGRFLAEGDPRKAASFLAEERRLGRAVPHLQTHKGGFQIRVPQLAPYGFHLAVNAWGERQAFVDLPRGVAAFRSEGVSFPSLREPEDFDLLGASRVDIYYRPLLEWVLGEGFLLLPHLLASGRTPAFPGEAFRVRHEVWLPLGGEALVGYDLRLGKPQYLRFPSPAEMGRYLYGTTYPHSPIHPVPRFALAYPLRLWGEGVLEREDLQRIFKGLRGYLEELLKGYASASRLLPDGEEAAVHLPDGSRLRLQRGLVRVVGGRAFSAWGMADTPPPPSEEAPWAMEVYWSAWAWEEEIPFVDLHAFLPAPIETSRGRIYFTPHWALLVEEPPQGEAFLSLEGPISL